MAEESTFLSHLRFSYSSAERCWLQSPTSPPPVLHKVSKPQSLKEPCDTLLFKAPLCGPPLYLAQTLGPPMTLTSLLASDLCSLTLLAPGAGFGLCYLSFC